MPVLAVVLQAARISSSLVQALLIDPHSHGCRIAGLLGRSTRIAFPSLVANKTLFIRGKVSATQQTKDTTQWDDAADLYFSRRATDDGSSHHRSHQPQPQPGVSSTEGKQQFDGKTRNAAAPQREDQSLKDYGREEHLRVRVRRGLKSTDSHGSESYRIPNAFTAKNRDYVQRKSSRKEPSEWSRSYRNGVASPRKIAANNLEDNGPEDDDYGQNVGSRREWGRWDFREQKREPSEIPKLNGEAIYGVGPIRAALHACRRDLYTLYIQESLDLNTATKRKAKEDLSWIFDKAKSLKLGIVTTSKHVLNMLVDSRPHQGLVLDASPLELVGTHKLDAPAGGEAPPSVWVALDEVVDPQNLGAILRSAYFFGAKGVVVCAKNSAPLSGVVSKASAGALEVMELRFCRNMVNFLQNSIENGWRVVGSSAAPGSIPLHEILPNVPTILVLGNEGIGLRTNVQRTCTHIAYIPGVFPFKNSGNKRFSPLSLDNFVGPFGSEGQPGGAEVNCLLGPPMVDSLNVSVAAGNVVAGFSTPREQHILGYL